MTFKAKLAVTAGLIALGGLALAAPAHASAARPASATPAGTYYSENLAGYAATSVLEGLNDIRATIHVPSESTSNVPDQTVAGGLTLATGINGGDALGIGLVWNAPGGTGKCTEAGDANTWELEYTDSVKTGTPALEPVPLNLLTVLDVGGSPVCLTGGTSYYLEMYYSTYHHSVAFIAGPQEFTNENVLATIDHVHGVFYAAGAGVDTTSGTDAADLTTGTLASFTRVGLDNLYDTANPKSPTKRITFDAATTYSFVGTETGGSPSVSNPQTLTPGPFGSGSSFSVTVP
jgi:hypothetical protein